MKQRIRSLAKSALKTLGLGVTSYETLEKLRENENAVGDLLLLKSISENNAGKAIRLLDLSRSQLRQDIFVLSELGFKQDGFFVEFGATDGVSLNNTHLLERDFGWRGILAEPAKCWHADLSKNRTSKVDFDCVWEETGLTLDFSEYDSKELSTLSAFSSKDFHSSTRKDGISYKVNTVSLMDLLRRHDAPREIDYLSIDTEGSEYAILKAFDFNSYEISVITCEHNYSENRAGICELLASKGYKRKFENISRFDDWYVLE